MTLTKMIKEAVGFLDESLPDDEDILVGFSGGKDSIVTNWLMEKSRHEFDLVYSNTTIDPPDVIKFMRKHYPQVKTVRPTRSFWKMIPASNPPLIYAKWCCTMLKKRPAWKLPHKHRVFGIRKEEGPRRRNLPRINLYKTKRVEHIHYHPILEWKEWAVWELIKRKKLAYPDLYEHFDRLGCVVCPMRKRVEHEKWRKLYPGYYKAFESAVRKWYNKRVGQGRTMNDDCVEDFIEAWYDQKATWYNKPKEE